MPERSLKWARLREHIEGVAWKRLTPHEVDPAVSNGHEFQGINRLRELLGAEDRRGNDAFSCSYARFDEASDGEEVEASALWYDSRRSDPTRASEWRLYYPAEAGVVQQRCAPGDLMIVAKLRSGSLRILLIAQGSSWERKAQVLLGVDFQKAEKRGFQVFPTIEDYQLNLSSVTIAEEFGLLLPDDAAPVDGAVMRVAEHLIQRFPEKLPPSKDVSKMIREAVPDVDPLGDPDGALVAWMEWEEAAFRQWERAKVMERLKHGFVSGDQVVDVDAFLSFSMSVFQTRKPRAGFALQNHAAAIFEAHELRFAAQALTEYGERPDFIFPGQSEYDDPSFPASSLRLLAVKTTAKDRFRQVLQEAGRISNKHLLTLEPAISESITANMKSNSLQLVVPRTVQETYTLDQKGWLWTVNRFITDVRNVQR
jgi:hypothetical protein